MAEYTIDKIEYGDNVYKLQDSVSGYVTGSNVVPYLTCGSGAGTVAKTTTLVTGTLPETLTTGVRVAVKFINSNTASDPKITIGSYGAIAIKRYGTTAPSTSAATSWNAGNVITLVYDGTYWLMADWTSPNTTYSEISAANITNASGSSTGLVTGRRAKAAVEAFEAITDVTVNETSVVSSRVAAITIPTKTSDLTNDGDGTSVFATMADIGSLGGGTITGVKTTAGAHTTIDVSSGNANFNVPTKTSHLTNDSGFITSYTDENVTSTKLTSDTKIYLTGSSSSSTVTEGLNKFAAISAWRSSYGYYIEIGDNNYRGHVLCYRGNYFIDVSPTTLTSSHYFYWPDKGGTIAVTDDLPSITLNGSSTTSPSFYAPTGAGTSGQYLKSSGSGAPTWTNFPTIPSITLNGSSTTSPSFYAPTGAGTSGQYLKSNGSGAPSWTNFPTIPSISLNGSSTTSPSFYAPTTAGTNGYYLTSNGSGAPSWTSFPTTISILQANVLDTNDTEVGSIAIDSNGAVEISNHNTQTKAVLDGGFSIVGSSGEIATIKSGGVFIQDHTNTTGAIGHFSSNDGTKSSFATGNSLTQINAPIKFSAGTWLIIGDVVYPNNTNGSRCVEWRSGATSSSLTSINASRVIVGTSSSGFGTRIQTIATVQSDADVYLSMYGYMYTGSSTTVSVDWYWQAIRIA